MPGKDQRVEDHFVGEELLGRVPGQPDDCVAEEHVCVRRGGLTAVHGPGDVLDERAEPSFAGAQLALGAQAFPDVAEADDDSPDSRIVEQVAGLDLDRDPLVVGVVEPHLEGADVVGARQQVGDRSTGDRVVVGMHEFEGGPAGDVLREEAERLAATGREHQVPGAVEEDDRVRRVLHQGPVTSLVDVGVALGLAAGEERREDADDGTQHPDRVVVPGPVAHDAVEPDETLQPARVHQGHRDDGADALTLELEPFGLPFGVELGDATDVDRVAASEGVAPTRESAQVYGLLVMARGRDAGRAPFVGVGHHAEVAGDREDVRTVDRGGLAEQRQRAVDRVVDGVRDRHRRIAPRSMPPPRAGCARRAMPPRTRAVASRHGSSTRSRRPLD